MSQIDKVKIERALLKKGFVQDDAHHHYFIHKFNGKETGVYTYTSMGSNYKTYGNELLSKMKKQLRLDTMQEVRNLLQCPMGAEEYNQKLKSKNLIPR